VHMFRSRVAPTVLLVAALALGTACGSSATAGDSGASGSGGKVDLVAYSTPQEAYGAIEQAFKDTAAGRGVDFTESYGASGDQSRAVANGQPADYVAFSLEPDISRLVKANLVSPDWNKNATKGIVTDSVVVFVVRKGNPKNINTWDDLTKKGVQVLNPNVFTSGGARWNVMAAYGAQIEQGKTEEQAVRYLHDLYRNIAVQDDSARKALQTFTTGQGDVLLAYENEAKFAQAQGEPIDYVVPDQTILIENPVALTTTGEKSTAAKAFYDYVFTKPAQEIFLENGYRPVNKDVPADTNEFPTPPDLFTIAKFGGWDVVMKKFFDTEKSVMKDVEEGIGVSVEQR
jgi:sulfate/thiosulfate transport system substrate-binding protein